MHIQNPTILRILAYFRIQDIFRHLSRLCELCDIENFAIFKTLAYLGSEAYSESYLYRHIQAYSGKFNNDHYNNINFPFFSPFFRGDAHTQPARDVPGTSLEGPKVWDLQGAFRGLLMNKVSF